MDYIEERISGEEKYRGVIVRVRLDQVRLCDGKLTRREVVEHPGGVCVLPVDEDGNCTMVRIAFLYQHMTIETAHFFNGEHANDDEYPHNETIDKLVKVLNDTYSEEICRPPF